MAFGKNIYIEKPHTHDKYGVIHSQQASSRWFSSSQARVRAHRGCPL